MIKYVDHIAIQTNNFDVAFDFYTRILGLTIVKKPYDYKGVRRLCYLKAGNINVELYSIKAGQGLAVEYTENRGGVDHIAFVVDDIKSEVQRLAEEGVSIVKEPFYPPIADTLKPLIAFIEGPDKQEIELREDLGV